MPRHVRHEDMRGTKCFGHPHADDTNRAAAENEHAAARLHASAAARVHAKTERGSHMAPSSYETCFKRSARAWSAPPRARAKASHCQAACDKSRRRAQRSGPASHPLAAWRRSGYRGTNCSDRTCSAHKHGTARRAPGVVALGEARRVRRTTRAHARTRATRSPGLRCETPGPTATTWPELSCPITIGAARTVRCKARASE
jgi:hypothetical protein